jgi:hypothetical protein
MHAARTPTPTLPRDQPEETPRKTMVEAAIFAASRALADRAYVPLLVRKDIEMSYGFNGSASEEDFVRVFESGGFTVLRGTSVASEARKRIGAEAVQKADAFEATTTGEKERAYARFPEIEPIFRLSDCIDEWTEREERLLDLFVAETDRRAVPH